MIRIGFLLGARYNTMPTIRNPKLVLIIIKL